MISNQLCLKLITTLIDLKLTLSSCESFTGGAFSNALTNIPGASLAYKGGYIAYSQEMKESLGVPKDLIEKYGLISAQVSEAMAQQTQKLLQTNFAIAFTGNAGPGLQFGAEIGVAFVTIIFNEEQLTLRLEAKNLSREGFKEFAVEQVLSIIWKIIQ